jgi:hypothetical protein
MNTSLALNVFWILAEPGLGEAAQTPLQLARTGWVTERIAQQSEIKPTK